jgi:hypothetical protein
MMVWSAISWYSVGPIIAPHGRITATSVNQLEDVPQEEWYEIPLETVQNL